MVGFIIKHDNDIERLAKRTCGNKAYFLTWTLV